MRRIIITILIIISGHRLFGQPGDLNVNIEGLKNNKGKCIIYVFDSKEGFPAKPEMAFRTLSGEIMQNMCAVSISGLKPGEYAIAVVHDENSNDKIDTNFLGIPREGMGSSNNPKSFGPPSFNDSRFRYTGEEKTLEILIKYI